MTSRITLPCFFVAIATLGSGTVWGQGVPMTVGPADLTLTRPLAMAEAPPATDEDEAASRGPLMLLLDRVGVGRPLDDAHINLYGHVEVGYTYNFARPPVLHVHNRRLGLEFDSVHLQNIGRSFDIEHNLLVLNQLDLNVERTVDATTKHWDVGGRAELLYGADAELVHANGLGEHFDTRTLPDYQFDPLQLYVDVAVPVGNGLRLRLGKFTYFYAVDPNESVFYSHSFTLASASGAGALTQAAVPLTLTGGSAEYYLSDRLTVEGGVSLGWNQALRDNNQAVDVFGRVRYDLSENTGLTIRAIVGPEQTNDNGDWRVAVEGVLSHRFSDRFTLVVNPVFGFQPNKDTATFSQHGRLIPAGVDAYWWGVASTGVYLINPHVSAGGRLEVFRDDGGYTSFVSQTLYEATVGLTVIPFPDDHVARNFKIRPEFRFDYSDARYFNFLTDAFTGKVPERLQITFGVDAIFNF